MGWGKERQQIWRTVSPHPLFSCQNLHSPFYLGTTSSTFPLSTSLEQPAPSTGDDISGAGGPCCVEAPAAAKQCSPQQLAVLGLQFPFCFSAYKYPVTLFFLLLIFM